MPRAEDTAILDTYDLRLPLHGNGLDLFKTQWTSKIPGYDFGYADHFDDHRILWLERQCGGFTSKRILELGPMDGAHTHALATRGGEVTAIEASTRSYLRCLVMKEVLNFDAKYLLGDFRLYLEQCPSFDLVVASGVLYHMNDPFDLLQKLSRASDRLFLWTHYYDPDVVMANPQIASHLSDRSETVERMGLRLDYWPYHYNAALERDDFSGGSTSSVRWMTQEGIFAVLSRFGYEVTVYQDHKTHPSGAAMSLYARRNATPAGPLGVVA